MPVPTSLTDEEIGSSERNRRITSRSAGANRRRRGRGRGAPNRGRNVVNRRDNRRGRGASGRGRNRGGIISRARNGLANALRRLGG